MSDLLELAERCEKAEAGSMNLDRAILSAIGYTWRGMAYWSADNTHTWPGWPTPTRSIDAALTLVPEGWGAEMYAHPGDCCARAYLLGEFEGENSPHRPTLLDSDYCIAKTVALALCAAALRARALSPGSSPDRAETSQDPTS